MIGLVYNHVNISQKKNASANPMHFHWASEVQEVSLSSSKDLHPIHLRHVAQPAHRSEERAPEIVSLKNRLSLLK